MKTWDGSPFASSFGEGSHYRTKTWMPRGYPKPCLLCLVSFESLPSGEFPRGLVRFDLVLDFPPPNQFQNPCGTLFVLGPLGMVGPTWLQRCWRGKATTFPRTCGPSACWSMPLGATPWLFQPLGGSAFDFWALRSAFFSADNFELPVSGHSGTATCRCEPCWARLCPRPAESKCVGIECTAVFGQSDFIGKSLSCSVTPFFLFFVAAPLQMIFPKKSSLFSRVTEQLSSLNDENGSGQTFGFLG